MTLAAELFGQGMDIFAEEMADGTYDIYRPDYTSATTYSSVVARKVRGRVDVGGTYADPKIPGVQYYSIFFKRSLIAVGDIIVRNPSQDNQPAITIQNTGNPKELVAFRSHKIGAIYTDIDKAALFSKVRFDFCALAAQAQEWNPGIPNSTIFEKERVIIHRRAGIEPGMRFVDDQNTIYKIETVTDIEPIMHLTLSESEL